jgi:hypothetical protein
MPTPFMHLQIAERVLAGNQLNSDTGVIIAGHLPAFYLGNVAPDYQTISKIPREETHFYNLPPGPSDDACMTMLDRFPELAVGRSLSNDHATFISAYCSHLMLDLRWYREILVPFFLGPGEWTDLRHRFVVHNTLLTYLDEQAFRSLPESAAGTLEAVKPVGWLPFAKDNELNKWRDFLVKQLMPGSNLYTVEIYAERLSMSPEEFADNLSQPAWMDEHVFNTVPLETVLSMLDSAVDDTVDLILNYFTVT